MRLQDLFLRKNINAGVARFLENPDAVLLDVRTTEEYADYHIPCSVNLPLRELHKAETHLPDKSAPVYVYCLSGQRSARAVSVLRQSGYQHVVDIGGIAGYRGNLVTSGRAD